MSRDILSEELAGEHSDIPDYEPGNPTFAPELREDVLEYFENLLGELPEGLDIDDEEEVLKVVKMHVEDLEEMFSKYGSFDADIFIDNVMRNSGDMNPYDQYGELWSQLFSLDRLVQALYNVGYNDFHIDLNVLPTVLWSAAHNLEGTENNPLTVTYVGDVEGVFGRYNQHCDITIMGNAGDSANDSEHCTYRFEGGVGYFGSDSSNCDLHVQDMESCFCMTYGDDDMPQKSRVFVHSIQKESPSIFDLSAASQLYDKGFYKAKNRLYAMKQDGTWNEKRYP